MRSAEHRNARIAAVHKALARVSDPELDEAITDLGFIEQVALVGRDGVEVEFRLPTYWCSPNFAFMMADDIRREVSALPWAGRVRVRLLDHCYGDRVNRAVNDGTGFDAAFAEFSDGADLSALRAKFRMKAFQRRQETMLLALVGTRGAGEIAAMTLSAFDRLPPGTGGEAAAARYRESLVENGLAAAPDDLAFRTWEGDPLAAEDLREYLAELRAVRLNMEFSSALCRGLQQARYKEAPDPGAEPELIDFILNRVPPREAAAKPAN